MPSLSPTNSSGSNSSGSTFTNEMVITGNSLMVPANHGNDEKENYGTSPTSSSAFTIISSDNITSFGKPNAIVRPLRHMELLATIDDRRMNLNNLESQIILNHQQLKGNYDSNENINNNSKTNNKNDSNNNNINKNSDKSDFDLKIRRLQKDKLSKNGQLPVIQQKRPLFITTVPKGVFLSPVREIRDIPPIQSRHVYSYMSHPRILHNHTNNVNNHKPGKTAANNPTKLGATTTTTTTSTDADKSTSASLFNGIARLASGVAGFRFGRSISRESQSQTYQNVMYDKRVVRGSNFSGTNAQTGGEAGDCCLSREQEAQRRNQIRKKTISQRTQRGIIGTPPAVKGRKHEPVQTEKYLEEIYARPPEYDASCQTDLFLHRPITPPYIPAKIGHDIETDIKQGDLFDFDTEVQPLLETLIGKTVDQSLVEILFEEELADLKEQQHRYLAIRECELSELRRLEEQEKRLQSEKDLRLRQEEISHDLDREMQERVTAAKLLQGHIAKLLPGVLKNIEALTEAENREQLERQLGPWLANEVAEEVGQMIDSRDLLEEIVRDILKERAELYIAMMCGEPVPVEPTGGEEEEEEETGDEQVKFTVGSDGDDDDDGAADQKDL